VKDEDGPEIVEDHCICVANEILACDPKTRLNVILPNVRGIGTWRLETKSWNAAEELPGMVELIQSLQAKGITRATLRLEHKQSLQAGVKRKFIVPVLGLDETVEALVAGQASVGKIGAGPASPGGGEGGDAAAALSVRSAESEEPVAVDGLSAQSLPLDRPEVVEVEVVSDWAEVQKTKVGGGGVDARPADTPAAVGVPGDAEAWRVLCREAGVTQSAVLREAQRLAGSDGPGSLAALSQHEVAGDVAAWVAGGGS